MEELLIPVAISIQRERRTQSETPPQPEINTRESDRCSHSIREIRQTDLPTALFRTPARRFYGIDAHLIDVEVDMFPSASVRDFAMVGMPDLVVRESRQRTKSIIAVFPIELHAGGGDESVPVQTLTEHKLNRECWQAQPRQREAPDELVARHSPGMHPGRAIATRFLVGPCSGLNFHIWRTMRPSVGLAFPVKLEECRMGCVLHDPLTAQARAGRQRRQE